MEPIAIVGHAFRLPPHVEDESTFWEMLQSGRNVMTEWPESRVDLESFYDARAKHDNMLTARGGHFLAQEPGVFDAPFFAITSKEAAAMDPQQRWLLEASYRALENAGIPAEKVAGSQTGVFAASMTEDYTRMISKDPDDALPNTGTGNNPSILANRLSWYFDMRGPSITINTACSSSMIAMDLACQSLRSGQSSAAMVGGASALLSVESSLQLSAMNFLSPDNLCHSFDARANGYSRGEGVVVIVLKRLSDAIHDSDTIRAVIRATAQEDLIRRVYKSCSLNFEETRYFEAHGTGTQAGDSAEVNALGRVFRSSRCPEDPLYIGSIKSNIGHLEGASALAGILKCISMLERGVIPPQALFQKMNPKINAKFYNIQVPTKCVTWPSRGLRRISINSFGFGGSNGHMILDDAYHTLERLAIMGIHNTLSSPLINQPQPSDDNALDILRNDSTINSSSSETSGPESSTSEAPTCQTSGSETSESATELRLLTFSAKDEAALRRMLEAYATYYSNQIAGSTEKAERLAHVLAERRTIMPWRSFAVVHENARSPLPFASPVRSSRDNGIAFIFTGQGAQYAGMGKQLLRYRVFRDTFEHAGRTFRELGADWAIYDALEDAERINKPELSQPLCTALQIALVGLLKSWNITPAAVAGHSSGEIAAAYCAGMLSIDSACRIAYHRGRLAGQLASSGSAAMISVNLPEEAVPQYLAKVTLCKAVHIACVNSPLNTTLSGEESDIDTLKKHLDDDGVFAQKLKTGVAYHSPAMQAIAAEYESCLEGLTQQPQSDSPTVMISSVTGNIISSSAVSQSQYWVDNLVSPVRFADALQYMTVVAPKEGHSLKIFEFLEIGPHGALRRPIHDTITQLGKRIRYASILSRFDTATRTSLEVAGNLFARGVALNIAAVNHYDKAAQVEVALVDMPAYPFDRSQRYWHESRLSSDWRLRGRSPREVLGVRSFDWNPLEPRWRKLLSIDESPWIADHVVGDTALYPGAGTLVMALEAVRQNANPGQKITGFFVKEATFMSPIVVKSGIQGRADVVTQLHPLRQTYEKTSLRSEVRIFSRQDERWQECFRAVIHIEYEDQQLDEVDGGFEARADAERHRKRWELTDTACEKSINKADFYKWAAGAGIRYGEAFQLADDVRWDGDLLSVSSVEVDAIEHEYEGLVHPAVFDAVCQTVFAAPSKGATASFPTLVPYKIHNAWVAATGWQHPQTSSIRAATVSRPKKGVTGMECELTALAEDGAPLVHIPRFEMLPMLRNDDQKGAERSLLYGIEWNPPLSLLSPTQLQAECSASRFVGDDTVQQDYMQRLSETLRAVIQHQLPELRAIDWSTVPPHYEKYVSWLDQRTRTISPRDSYSLEGLDELVQQLQDEKPLRKITTEVAQNLPSILRGNTDPLDFLFSTGLASELYQDIFAELCDPRFERYIDLLSHQTPTLRILEVGAGTGGFSSHILAALKRREERTGGISFQEYIYSDVSPSFFEKAKETFGCFGERIKFHALDIESDIPSQCLGDANYDVVFAGAVLHATRSLSHTLQNLRRALKPGGQLVFMEPTRPDLLFDGVAFGILPGWWLGAEDFRAEGPLVTEPQWDQILRDNGFSGNDLVLRDHETESAHAYSIIVTTACEPSSTSATCEEPRILYVVEEGHQRQLEVASALAGGNTGLSGPVISLADLKDGNQAKPEYVVFLTDMDGSLLSKIDSTVFSALKRRIQEWKDILWVTAPPSPSSAPYEGVKDGFLRALRSEYEHKHIVSLSVESSEGIVGHINRVFKSAFLEQSPELEYAVRNNQIVTPRLIAESSLNTTLNAALHPQLSTSSWLPGPPLKIDILHHGSLETLHYTEDTDYYKSLAPEDVEIEAKAWDLNFRDVFIALGRLEEETFGDCAGTVTRVGTDVQNVKPGDRVVMMGPGAMKMYPRSRQWVSKIPDTMSFEVAAAVLNPGICAYYALVEVARLQKGEKVLIHAAAGGTGQMAVMVAQMVGAEVFCTVGFKDKKELLVHQLGVPKDHIFYSRNTSFKKSLKRMTDGYGVDVVLNSLVGEGLRASFECMAPYGRFIELGKADIKGKAQLPMECFANNVSFTAIDIVHLAQARPQLGQRVMQTVMELAAEGVLRSPMPLHTFGVDKAEEAFRYFQSGRNTGRTVITSNPEAQVQKRILHRKTWTFAPNATYVIAGGMGGIGRAMMKWMASRGAKHIIVPSRSSRSAATMQAAMETVEGLRNEGVTVATPRCDVSSASSLRSVLDECAKTMPPIRGCINAAMVLQDSVFDNMTHAQWTQTIDSKVATSWNLHTQLPDLDFFVMLASVAGVVGSPGQSNYAAGCTFQDALARQRTKQGQRALSIDLGVMRTIGIVAETGRLQKNFGESQAMIKIEEEEFLALLDLYCDPQLPLLSPDKSQIVMGVVTPADMIAKGEEPVDQLQRPLFANFARPKEVTLQAGSSASANFAALFAQAGTHEQRAGIVIEALAHKLARALSISPEDVDADKPLHVFGVDSLVAVELRNWIGKEFAAEVAVFDIMGSPSVAAIGDLVAKLSKAAKAG